MKISKSFAKTVLSIFLLQVIFLSTSCGQKEHRHGEEGEESGKKFIKSEVCKEVKKGTKLHLEYDESASAFLGTIENVSTKVIKKVRVEVHLSNGIELGPTKKVDLVPGEKVDIKLSAKDQLFEWWTTHAETGNSEHGHGAKGEHGEEGEHGKKSERGDHN